MRIESITMAARKKCIWCSRETNDFHSLHGQECEFGCTEKDACVCHYPTPCIICNKIVGKQFKQTKCDKGVEILPQFGSAYMDGIKGPCHDACIAEHSLHISSAIRKLLDYTSDKTVPSDVLAKFKANFIGTCMTGKTTLHDIMKELCKPGHSEYNFAEIMHYVNKYISPDCPTIGNTLIDIMLPFSKSDTRLGCYRKRPTPVNYNGPPIDELCSIAICYAHSKANGFNLCYSYVLDTYVSAVTRRDKDDKALAARDLVRGINQDSYPEELSLFRRTSDVVERDAFQKALRTQIKDLEPEVLKRLKTIVPFIII